MKANELDIDQLLAAVKALNEQHRIAADEQAKLEEQNRVTQLALVEQAKRAQLLLHHTGSPMMRKAYMEWANEQMISGGPETKAKATAVRNLLNHTNR